MEQLGKLLKEDKKSEEVAKMNIIFMSGTMIIFALLLYTKKMKHKGGTVNIVWCLNAYIVFRLSFGNLDYEETKPHMP